ncbi:hypothetical protein TNCV_4435691 [Trichonephila clavipes]|nr:hypothetical protein TNCV_4435691 [Trichonephila clavipes]
MKFNVLIWIEEWDEDLFGSFAMREKGGNRLVPGPDYMVDVLKLPNQDTRVSGESLQTCMAWRCPDRTDLFCWLILANLYYETVQLLTVEI